MSTLTSVDIREIEAFLYREARLLDELQLIEWLSLFMPDGIYWIPIDETQNIKTHAALVYDDAARREERVYHLQHLPFPAQSPASRTMHVVSNVERLAGEPGSSDIVVRSVQTIWELRAGDFTQIGLGKIRPLVGTVRHELEQTDDGLRIKRKTVLLIDRDMPQANLTFII
jgi:3-phenylpropionate/cinnamic acid dioxygenase small subunit